mmetsp:Transcript_2803/g.10144  ORF Transcript_2803/g.10144 Transcript_2803/m.10144 type:complete len:204 (-) Transcript_2803:2998-3609(-)
MGVHPSHGYRGGRILIIIHRMMHRLRRRVDHAAGHERQRHDHGHRQRAPGRAHEPARRHRRRVVPLRAVRRRRWQRWRTHVTPVRHLRRPRRRRRPRRWRCVIVIPQPPVCAHRLLLLLLLVVIIIAIVPLAWLSQSRVIALVRASIPRIPPSCARARYRRWCRHRRRRRRRRRSRPCGASWLMRAVSQAGAFAWNATSRRGM